MIPSIHNIYNILYQLVQKPKFTLGIYVFKCGSSQKLSLGLDWAWSDIQKYNKMQMQLGQSWCL